MFRSRASRSVLRFIVPVLFVTLLTFFTSQTRAQGSSDENTWSPPPSYAHQRLQMLLDNIHKKFNYKLRTVEIQSQSDGLPTVFVEFMVGANTERITLDRALLDTYHAVFSLSELVETGVARVRVSKWSIDKYGHDVAEPIYDTRMQRETAAKINWPNRERIPNPAALWQSLPITNVPTQ